MANIAKSLTDLVGKTPLMELSRFSKAMRLEKPLVGKLESMNPLSSVKDRVGKALIEDAEQKGLLKSGGTIVEPTSGNTGIALAFAGVSRGYRVILTMPDTMSVERRMLLAALGAELVLTPGSDGMTGAIARAEQLAGEIKGALWFFNPYSDTCPDSFPTPPIPLLTTRQPAPKSGVIPMARWTSLWRASAREEPFRELGSL